MNSKLIIPTLAIALSAALPTLAASEITGTLSGGASATSSGGSLSGTVAGTSTDGSLSGTVATSSGGNLSGTVVSPTTTSTGGGGGGGGSIGIFPTTTSATTTTPGSVLGTSTPGLPNTGAGGNWFETMLALITSAAIGISGIAYLKYRTLAK